VKFYGMLIGERGRTPGPAQRIMDGTLSVRMSSLNTPFSPTRSSCPTNSSSDFGLIRSASGCASSAAFLLTFFGGGASFDGSGGGVATTGFGGVGGGGAGLFFAAFEKNPVPTEGWKAGRIEFEGEATEWSDGSLQLLSMCLFMDDSGTFVWQMGHSTSWSAESFIALPSKMSRVRQIGDPPRVDRQRLFT
jgi:hypothetical protein